MAMFNSDNETGEMILCRWSCGKKSSCFSRKGQ